MKDNKSSKGEWLGAFLILGAMLFYFYGMNSNMNPYVGVPIIIILIIIGLIIAFTSERKRKTTLQKSDNVK